jgi:tetratricopeptide (TPR) repeat protein
MAKLPDIPQSRMRVPVSGQALDRAVFALQMRQPAEAERIAAEVLKANRGDPRALQIYSQALMLQGRAVDAIPALEKAARRNDDPAIATQLAVLLRMADRHDEALQKLRQAVGRRPPFAAAFVELGQQLMALARHDEAVDVLARGVAVAPDVAELSVQLGHVLTLRNDRAGARAAFTRALALAPDRPDVLHALAQALQADRQYGEAAGLFRRLLNLKPDDPAVRVGLGLCLLEIGDTEQGLNCFRAAMRSGPQMYGQALAALASSSRGRFWLRPSDAVRFMRGET